MGKVEYEALQEWILLLPNVSRAPHRFGGTEFQANGLEFMHSHGYSHLDIRLSKEAQTQILKEGKAEEHRFAPQAGWVTFILRSQEDMARVKEVIELAYTNAREVMAAHETRNTLTPPKA